MIDSLHKAVVARARGAFQRIQSDLVAMGGCDLMDALDMVTGQIELYHTDDESALLDRVCVQYIRKLAHEGQRKLAVEAFGNQEGITL